MRARLFLVLAGAAVLVSVGIAFNPARPGVAGAASADLAPPTIGGTWTAWLPVSGAGLAAGPVTFAPGSNGSLQELFVTNPRGQIWSTYEKPSGAWSAWHPVSGAGLAAGPVTFAPGSNGSLQELFATAPHGQVFTTYELPSGAWSAWHPASGPGLATGPVTFAPGSNGSLQELFATAPHGQVFTTYELPSGAWSPWHPASGPGLATGPVTFAPGSNGSLQELFATAPHGQVFTTYELPSGAWSPWHPASGPGLATGPVTFAPGSNGSLQELFATAPHGQVFTTYELPSGAWSPWHPASGPGLATGPVTFAPGSNGSLQELFVTNPRGQIWSTYEKTSGAWSAWHAMTGTGITVDSVTFAPGSNGSLQELFAAGAQGQIFNSYEIAPAVVSPQGPPTSPPVQWCESGIQDPYIAAPAGAVTVPAGDNSGEPFMQSFTEQPNVTYWFAPGVHTFGTNRFSQIAVDAGDVFIGGPGAILSGQDDNSYAFSENSSTPMTTPMNATIEYLTIEDYVAGTGEMVVGQGGYDGWTIEHNTIENNPYGAGVALATNGVIKNNCLQHNGEYGYSSLEGTNNATFTDNDVYDNNVAGYYDVAGSTVQCGCSGGGKLWMTTNSVIDDNYVHNNIGVGVWVDTDNAGIDISGNYIADNWGEAVVYEISYNGNITDNYMTGNDYGDVTSNVSPSFPSATIYISNSGDSPAVSSNYNGGTMYVSGNVLVNNWGGMVLFQDSNRVCGFSVDGTCTLPVSSTYTLSSCKAAIGSLTLAQAEAQVPGYLTNCVWPTQDLQVSGNTVQFDPANLYSGPFAGTTDTCQSANTNGDTYCGMMGLFSYYGSIPAFPAATDGPGGQRQPEQRVPGEHLRRPDPVHRLRPRRRHRMAAVVTRLY